MWTGPFRRLPRDVLALGFASEFFSKALADQTVETVLEAAYSFNITTVGGMRRRAPHLL